MLNICFSSGSLDMLYTLGRGCFCDQLPGKTLGAESLMSFLCWQHFTSAVTACLGRIKHIPHATPQGRSLGSGHLLSPKTSFHMPFPFTDCALHLFAVINHSYEYDLDSPVSFPSESLNLGMISGTSNTRCYRSASYSILPLKYIKRHNTSKSYIISKGHYDE